MTNDDLQQIGKLIDTKLSATEKRLEQGLDKRFSKRLDGRLAFTEKRLEQKIDERITRSEKKIYGDIGEFLEERLIPLIEEKADKTDIDRIERKLDVLSAKVMGHGTRLDDIESLPTVAHELKLKKKSS